MQNCPVPNVTRCDFLQGKQSVHPAVKRLTRESKHSRQNMSKSQRNKGRGYELEVCKTLSDSLGLVTKRNIGQSRDGGDDITLPPFRIECKRRAKIAIYDWMDQCTKSCLENDVPVVIIRGDAKESLVVMKLPDWIKLAREEICK
jgi:hypothetical protein